MTVEGPDRPAGLHIPRAWEELPVEELRGVLFVVGAPDAGKTTFARYLFQRLAAAGLRSAFLDGDPGQSSLGPPTVLSLALPKEGETSFPPVGRLLRRFAGSTTASRHMLAVLVGAAQLAEAARQAGAQVTVYDTSGLISPTLGGPALKYAKFDLLNAAAIFAIQRKDELEPLLKPLRRSRRFRLFTLAPSSSTRRRSSGTRQEHRALAFARYFSGSRRLEVDWPRFSVIPAPRFQPNRLVALEDVRGFTLGLGIVEQVDPENRRVELITPVASLEGVDALHVGDVLVDPLSFRDRLITITDEL